MQPTVPAAGKQAPRAGNLGHITRISNKLFQLGNISSRIQTYLQVGGKLGCTSCICFTEYKVP
jgi:hypothetical protein